MTFRKTTENGTVKQNTEYSFDSRGRMIEEIHHDEVVGGTVANWDFAPVEASSGIVDGSDVNAATVTTPAALMNLASLTSTTTDTNHTARPGRREWQQLLRHQSRRAGDAVRLRREWELAHTRCARPQRDAAYDEPLRRAGPSDLSHRTAG